MRRILPLLAVLGLAVAPAAAAQDRERTIDRSPLLWSTVNICDTAKSPDTMGVRAQMPGSGRRGERMYMRFRAQYFDEDDGNWHNFVAKGLDSGWVSVGAATFRARQSGWSFPFALEDGQRYELRAVVRFEWRKGRRVVRSATKKTTKGHPTALAEPRRFSAATCVVRG